MQIQNRFLLIPIFLILCVITCCKREYIKLNNNGYKKIEANDYDGAFKDFDSSISINDKYWLSYCNRGASYLLQGDYQKAIADFDKSINLLSRNPMAFDNRGMCKLFLGDSVGALNDFRTAHTFNKNDIKVQTHLGRLLAEMDSCKEAIIFLDVSIQKKAFDNCNSEQELRELKNKCELKK